MYSKPIDREARLRRKLVNNEMNPVADLILSLVLLFVTPFLYLFSQIHDKLMFKFLNRTYIYNVSWEVSSSEPPLCLPLTICPLTTGSPHGPQGVRAER